MHLTRWCEFATLRLIVNFAVLCCLASIPPGIASQDPQTDLARARALEKQGAFEEAATKYQAVLKNPPTSKEAQLGLGRSLASMGQCERAMDALRAILQVDSEAEAVVGVCYFRFHEFDPAISHLEQAVRLA